MKNISELPTLELPFELLVHEHATRYQQWIISAILPYLGKRILELGAGIGNMSRWMAEQADRLILTEGSTELLTLLSERMKKNFPESSNLSMQLLDIGQEDLSAFKNENLDTIISFNVLEH